MPPFVLRAIMPASNWDFNKMKPETLEWINKAEGDLAVAQREMQAPVPVWNVVCFLAQQCAEKYLKAFLEENGIAFEKKHDLVLMLNLSGGLLPELDSHRQELAHLSTFGIAARFQVSKLINKLQ
jgi:HEPN domain-containing protein